MKKLTTKTILCCTPCIDTIEPIPPLYVKIENEQRLMWANTAEKHVT